MDPLRIELTDAGFTPDASALAIGQSVWVDNVATASRSVTLDGVVASGPIPVGGRFVFTLPTTGTFTLVDDAAADRFATLTIGRPGLDGPANSNAIFFVPNVPAPSAPIDEHPDLAIEFSRNRVLIAPRSGGTVAQFNAALADNGLVVVGGLTGGLTESAFVVAELVGGAAPTDVAVLHAVLDDLRSRTTVVRVAALDIRLDPESALPRPVDPDPYLAGSSAYGTWDALVATDGSARGVGANRALESARFPQAWNLRDEARRRSPAGPNVDTVVLDVGFDTSQPDVAAAQLHRLCTPGDVVCTDNPVIVSPGDPNAGRPNSNHGNPVAATIGAPFDRGPRSDRTSVGLVGGNPEADLHLVPIPREIGATARSGAVTFFTFAQSLNLISEFRNAKFSQLKVINLSAGTAWNSTAWHNRWGSSTCGPGANDDQDPTAQQVACTPNTLDAYLAEIRAVAEVLRPFTTQLGSSGVLLVVAAGNDSRQLCITRPVTTPCTQFERIAAANIDLFAWIDQTWTSSGGRGSPILMVEAYDYEEITDYSNLGRLSAPGTVLGPRLQPDGTFGYQLVNGTSFAAPLVSAAAGFIAALAPTMQGDAIAAHLRARARSDVQGTVTPRLDVFEAVLSLPDMAQRLVDVNDATLDGNARVVRNEDGSILATAEERTGNVAGPRWSAPDGNVDLRDFRVFRDAFLFGCRQGAIVSDACPPAAAITLDGDPFHPKHDTNLDGCIQGDGLAGCNRPENLFSRLDFNGDGRLDDRRVVVPLTATGAVAPPGQGTLKSDLEVLASRWGLGPNPDTGGYPASRLTELLSSADVEVRFERLWAAGATSAEVEVISIVDPTDARRATVPRPPANTLPWRVFTVPVMPIAEPSLIQVRVTATIPGRDTPAIFLSPLLDALPGQDLTVVPCADQLTLTADPVVPDPGGTSRLTARLVDCLGNGVAGEQLEFRVVDAPTPSFLGGEAYLPELLDPSITLVTGADGRATTTFEFPERELGPARVLVTGYPALDAGAPLAATVDLGEEYFRAPGVTLWYRSREVIEEYVRISTNDRGEDQDDCDGPIDATGSPHGCFLSTQFFGFPDSIDVNPGVIMLDRRGLIDLDDALAFDEVRVLGGPEADEFDPTVHYGFVPLVTNVTTWPAGNEGAATTQEVFSSIQTDTVAGPSWEWSETSIPIIVPDLTYTVDGNGLRVFGLSGINDGYYWSGTRHLTAGRFDGVHPDAPTGWEFGGRDYRHQIPTQLGILNRIDGTSFPFAANVDGPLTIQRSANGNFLTYVHCARNDRSLVGGGGYWSDDDPLWGWGRDPDDQRFERQPGDRAAPNHLGVVRAKVMFVATVSLDGTPPPPGALDLPECDPQGADASFTVSANPLEGRVVRFTPTTGRLPDNERLEYQWTFGDGNTSTDRSPEHVYEDSGEYIVTLVVTDPEGGEGVASQQISVANTPPNLWIDAVRPIDSGVEFDLTIGEWSVIDGLGVTIAITGSTGWPVVPAAAYPIGSHTIAVTGVNPGTYTVTVNAIDKDGGLATRTVQLTVSAAPTAGTLSPFVQRVPLPDVEPVAPPSVDRSGVPDLGHPATTSLERIEAATVTGPVGTFTVAATSPLAAATVPAFVLSTTTTDTAAGVAIRNVSRTNGELVGTVFDLGDGRVGVPITAGSTRLVSYLTAGDVTVSTALAGLSVRSPLAVTGVPTVAVVVYDGATTGHVGQLVTVRAVVSAGSPSGTRVAGRPVAFSLSGTTVDAVSGDDGVAATQLRVPAPAGAATLTVSTPAIGDDDGSSVTVPFAVLANEPPTVTIGGPFVVAVDGVLTLSATATDADDGAGAVGLSWDLDGDGDFDDAVGTSPVITPAQLASLVCGGACTPGAVSTISVRATDPKGATATDSTTVTTIADFALGVTPASALLVPSSQTSFTVSVFSTNGFAQPVALSAPTLPNGVTASFNPPSVTPNGTSVMTLRVGSLTETLPSTPIVVRGTAGSLVRETGTSVTLDFGLLPVCTGTISGRVTNVETGEPLAGIVVGVPNSTISGTTTDADGRYTITGFPLDSENGPRLWSLRFSGTGWVERSLGAFAACNAVTQLDAALSPLRFGTLTGTVYLADPAGAIIGPLASVAVIGPRQVGTNAQGQYRIDNVPLGPNGAPINTSVRVNPLANVRHGNSSPTVQVRADTESVADVVVHQMCFASVRARIVDDATGLAIPFGRATIAGRNFVADAQGIVMATGIPLGEPDNRAYTTSGIGRPPTGTTINRPATLISIPRCGAVTPADLPVTMPVPSSATIVATFVDAETGEPVEGLRLRLGTGADSPTASGPDGVVRWTVSLGLNVSSTFVTATARGDGRYFSSETQSLQLTNGGTREATFEVLRVRRGAVEGRVTDIVTGQPIAGIPVNGGFAGYDDVTDADGRYRIENLALAPGNLPLTYSITAASNSTRYWRRVQTGVVTDGGSTVVDFALIPVCAGATVRGRVVNAETGEPLEGALIGTGTATTTTDVEGRFVITGIPVGTDNAPRSIWVSASKSGFTTSTRTITVYCGADITVDFGAADVTNAAIVGTVTDPSGSPVAGVFVGAGFGAGAVTANDGTYRIDSVPAPSDGATRTWQVTFLPEVGTGFRNETRDAVVRSGQTTTVDVTLSPADVTTNQPPTARITSTPDVTSAAEGSVVTLSAATSSDVDGTVVRYQWDLGDDGSIELDSDDVGLVEATTFPVTLADDGVVTIRLRVTDDEGATATAVRTITFTNVAPTVTLADDLSVTGGDVTRTGSFSDPGTADTHTATVDWGDGDGPVPLELDGSSFSLAHTYAEPGDVTIRVRVCDDDGGCGTAEFTVSVTVANRPPTATAGSATVRSGREVPIVLAGVDPDGDPLTFQIVDPPTRGTLTGEAPELRYTPDDGELGEDRFTFTVSDGEFVSEPAAVVITITAGNVPPTAVISGPTTAPEGSVVTLDASSSTDADGTIVAIEWGLGAGEEFDVGSQPTLDVSLGDDGSVVVRLRVTDDEGATGVTSRTILFTNVAPTIDFDDEPTVVGNRVVRAGTFDDPGVDDTHTATVDWGDGAGPGTLALGDGSFELDHVYTAAGPYTVVVEICDDDGGCTTVSFPVTIEPPRVPQAPVAQITGPSTAIEGSVVTLSGSDSVNPDGQIVDFAWGLGAGDTFEAGTGATFDVTLVDQGTVTVRLRVTDDEGLTHVTSFVVTFTDAAPVIVLADDLRVAPDGSVSRSGSIVDPGLADTHVVTVDWGEGAGPVAVPLTGRRFLLDHRFALGDSLRVTDTDRIGPHAVGGIHVVVVRACDTELPDACDTATFDVTIPGVDVEPPTSPVSDLSVAIAAPASMSPGSSATVVVTVRNDGPDAAEDVALRITIPAGLVATAPIEDGWTCTVVADGRSITCLPTVERLAIGVWVLSIPVTASGSVASLLQFTAEITATTTDPAVGDNTASASSPVVPVVTWPDPPPASPPPTTPSPPPRVGTLPATGTEAGGLPTVALWLMLAGMALVTSTRRRRIRR